MSNQPSLKAEFILDKGKPDFFRGKKENHYKIRLYLDDVPDDVNIVTYRLDDTYYDPIREAVNKKNSFECNITSYGDYEIKINALGKNGNYSASRKLSEALEDYYHEHRRTNEILNVIEEIKVK